MDKEESFAARLASVDEQLAAALAQREQINAHIADLTRQRRYIAWLLNVHQIRQSIRQLTIERDALEEQMSEAMIDDDDNSTLEATLKDAHERLAAAEDSLASLLANPPGNIEER